MELPMLKIYGVPFSAHTRKVLVAAIEKDVPFEHIRVIPLTPP
jgi:glutathione S-transferase